MVAKSPEYLVNHGKTGVLGRFLAPSLTPLARGDRVVVEAERGLALGVVLCEASERHARLLGAGTLGMLLRLANSEDDALQRQLQEREQRIFDMGRRAAVSLGLPMEILDCELSLDGRRVILQYLLGGNGDPSGLVQHLSEQLGVEVWLENLAVPVEVEQEEGGCGEPGCGRAEGGSGCTTCGTGGGCSSCGTGKVDMKAYFGHLRDQMEQRRTPLL
jgi:cell fate regulator YaaT (PSP1 superfamily)